MGSRIVSGEEKVKIFGEEINVNARIEYIEGYSGHADQEWLLNFIYSFISKPKHIFLVHGEPNGQEVLKEKIIETINIPVDIPEYGNKYELGEDVSLIEVLETFEETIIRPDVLLNGEMSFDEKTKAMEEEIARMKLETRSRLRILEKAVAEMIKITEQDLSDEKLSGKDVVKIRERIKEMEQYMLRIIE